MEDSVHGFALTVQCSAGLSCLVTISSSSAWGCESRSSEDAGCDGDGEMHFNEVMYLAQEMSSAGGYTEKAGDADDEHERRMFGHYIGEEIG